MDINQIHTLLRTNGLADVSSDEEIRSLLSRASYTEEEIKTALMMIRGGGSLPSIPLVSQPASVMVAPMTPNAPIAPVKKRSFLTFLLPKKWLSIRGLITAIVLYFVVLPLGGWGLMVLCLLMAAIPGVGGVGLLGALFLLMAGSVTGINALVDAYSFFGYHAVANIMNTTKAPYEILSVPCDQGYAFRLDAKDLTKVERTYFDAVPIGYVFRHSTEGLLTMSVPSTRVTIPFTSDALGDSSFLRKDRPFLPSDNLFLFKDYDAPSNSMGLFNMLDEATGSGTGEPAQNFAVASLDASKVSLEEFSILKQCLIADEKKNGIIRNRSSLFNGIFGIGRVAPGPGPQWNSTDTTFSCNQKLSVALTFPNYLSVNFDSYGQPSTGRIGMVNADFSTRGLTRGELRTLSPNMWWDNYQGYTECIDHDKCALGYKGYDPVTGDPLVTGYTSFSSLSPGNQKFYIFTRNSYKQRYDSIGLQNGIPENFDSCKNSKRQTIREYLSGLTTIKK